MIDGPGKVSPGYNYWRVCGEKIAGKDKGEAENEARPVDPAQPDALRFMEAAFYIAGRRGPSFPRCWPLQRLNAVHAVVVSDCLSSGRGRGLLYHGSPAGGRAGSDYLRWRDHGPIYFLW